MASPPSTASTWPPTDGEFLVLLGPSGCGKTTLLRMIGGLEPPTGGDILIGGRVVTDLPPRARQIAMVFQSYALYPHMTRLQQHRLPPEGGQAAQSRAGAAGGLGGGHPGHRDVAGAQTAPALRRAAAAGGAGAGAGARADRLPARRTALQPRCPAARLGAGRAAGVPTPRRHDDASTSPTTRSRRWAWATASR